MNAVARPIEVITQEVNFYKNQAGVAIIEIGKRLLEAKQCLPHGQWGEWLEKEVKFSERTAQNFMKIAREIGNPQLIADMGNSSAKALLLLSVPADEREEFVGEAHEIDGEAKTVAEMTTKEMERLVKELEEERKKSGWLQEQLDVFSEKAQKQQDEAVDSVHRESEDKLERLTRLKEEADQKAAAAEEKVAQMETEMDELRMQAEQVSIPDESELNKIRAEAEKGAQEKMKKKLEKAKADADKAKADAKEAQEAIEAHEAAQKEAEEEVIRLREQLQKQEQDAEKERHAAGSTGITKFKVYFESVQGQINQMLACLQEVDEAESMKLKNAVKALCQSVLNGLEETE